MSKFIFSARKQYFKIFSVAVKNGALRGNHIHFTCTQDLVESKQLEMCQNNADAPCQGPFSVGNKHFAKNVEKGLDNWWLLP